MFSLLRFFLKNGIEGFFGHTLTEYEPMGFPNDLPIPEAVMSYCYCPESVSTFASRKS